MCFIGLGDGVIGASKGLVQGLWSLSSEVVRRNYDIALWLGGDLSAKQRLVKAGQRDEQTAQALVQLATNAVPAVHNYMAGEFEFYRDLPPARQSEVLCQVLGGVSFQTLLAAATAGSSVASQVTSKGSGGVRFNSGVASRVKQTMGSSVDDVDKAAARAGVKRKATTKALPGAALSALEKIQRDAIAVATAVLKRCGTDASAQPLSCLGLAAGASKEQIRAAYRKLSNEVHPDIWDGKVQQAGGVRIEGIAKEKLTTAQEAINKAYATLK